MLARKSAASSQQPLEITKFSRPLVISRWWYSKKLETERIDFLKVAIGSITNRRKYCENAKVRTPIIAASTVDNANSDCAWPWRMPPNILVTGGRGVVLRPQARWRYSSVSRYSARDRSDRYQRAGLWLQFVFTLDHSYSFPSSSRYSIFPAGDHVTADWSPNKQFPGFERGPMPRASSSHCM